MPLAAAAACIIKTTRLQAVLVPPPILYHPALPSTSTALHRIGAVGSMRDATNARPYASSIAATSNFVFFARTCSIGKGICRNPKRRTGTHTCGEGSISSDAATPTHRGWHGRQGGGAPSVPLYTPGRQAGRQAAIGEGTTPRTYLGLVAHGLELLHLRVQQRHPCTTHTHRDREGR